MHKNLMRTGIGLATILAMSAGAGADVVADFTDDFSYPTPAPGWSYLWNANGPIGSSANYVPLLADAAASGRYETENNTPDSFPDAAPGSSLSVTSTTMSPGQGTSQNGVERYVIAAYTISAADIAANGDQLILDLYSFGVPAGSADGVSTKVYKNDIPFFSQPLPPDFTFSYQTPATNGGPIPLGPFAEGDTLYIAIGANGLLGTENDIGDVLTVDYSIVLVPEPASAAILSLGASMLLMGRRRRSDVSR